MINPETPQSKGPMSMREEWERFKNLVLKRSNVPDRAFVLFERAFYAGALCVIMQETEEQAVQAAGDTIEQAQKLAREALEAFESIQRRN